MAMRNDPEKITLYADGGSRGNPGLAAMGVVIKNAASETIKEYGEILGTATNNEAEYRAVIFGLKKIKQLFGKKKTAALSVEIRSDSELLVEQNLGRYKVQNKVIRDLFIEIWNLRQDFGKIDFQLIPREENMEADRLVNITLDEKPLSSLF